MPVHDYGIQGRHDRKDLVDRIVHELKGQAPYHGETSADQPDIFIERDARDNHEVNIVVIWSKWEDVPEPQRPAIILDAFQRYGSVDKIIYAMGLTIHEAESLGMKPGDGNGS